MKWIKGKRFIKEILSRPNAKLISSKRTVGQNMWVLAEENNKMIDEWLNWTPAPLDLFKKNKELIHWAGPSGCRK